MNFRNGLQVELGNLFFYWLRLYFLNFVCQFGEVLVGKGAWAADDIGGSTAIDLNSSTDLEGLVGLAFVFPLITKFRPKCNSFFLIAAQDGHAHAHIFPFHN